MSIQALSSNPSPEIALLGLVRQGPLHGYAIHQELSRGNLRDIWRIKQARLYAMLSRLEEAGYLQGAMAPQPPRPPRKRYALTPAGSARFAEWLRTPVTRGRDLRLAFMLKLHFAHQTGPDAVSSLLAAQRDVCQEWLANASSSEATAPAMPQLVYRFRTGQVRAMMAWLDECETVLGKTPL